MLNKVRWRAAAKAFAVHLFISVVIAALVASVVFGIWYPWPYRDLTGAGFLFSLLIGVDVVCGPLLTALVFNPAKPRKELTRDLAVIAVLQLSALAYGIHSVALARPVATVFEIDRMVVVTAADVDAQWLKEAPAEMQRLRWTGEVPFRGVREPRDAEERWKSLDWTLQGLAPSMRPHWWVRYEENQDKIRQRMVPLATMRSRLGASEQLQLRQMVDGTGKALEALFFLPLVSQQSLDAWSLLLDEQGTPVGYVPFSGFIDD